MTINNQKIEWHAIPSQPFDENTYLIHRRDSTAGVIVDPGFEPEKILRKLRELGVQPVAILNTHGHSDHIAGNAFLKQRFPHVPLLIGALDAEKLTDPVRNLSAPFGVSLTSPPADQLLREGDQLLLADMEFTVWETPGHSRGHVVFVLKETQPWLIVGGDVLFRGSIGRTDFPDGDHETLLQVIRQKLFTLPDDSIVLTGHGPPTTIGEERSYNPFVGDRAGF